MSATRHRHRRAAAALLAVVALGPWTPASADTGPQEAAIMGTQAATGTTAAPAAPAGDAAQPAGNANDLDPNGRCKDAIKSLCADESPGDGRLAMCLRKASGDARAKKQSDPTTEACRKEVRNFFRTAARAPVDLNTKDAWWANPVEGFREACISDAKKLCKGSPPNKVMACLKSSKKKLSVACKQKVFDVQVRQSEDLGLDPAAFKACQPDIALFPACNVSEPLGAQAACLRENRNNLTESCRKELFRREQENSEDIRLNLPVYKKCKKEISTLCKDEEFGSARVFACLWGKSLRGKRHDFSQECKREVKKLGARSAQDYRLDWKLRTQCNNTIEEKCAAEQEVVNKMSMAELFGGKQKDGTFLFHGQGGKVIHCLKSHYKEIQADGCKQAVSRIVQVHALNWESDNSRKEACREDVKKFCADKADKPEEVSICLRKNVDKLSVDCKEAEVLLGSLESEDVNMKPLLLRACFSQIRDLCLQVMPGGGRIIECLQSHMTEPDFPPQCKERVADDLEASNHDWRLKYGISERCKDDVERLCSDADLSGKAPVLTCLKKKLKEVKSKGCESEMKKYIKQGLENIRFSPVVNGHCTYDVSEFCSDVRPGGGRVHECLLRHRTEISKPCAEAEFHLKSLEAENAKLNPSIVAKCSAAMEAFCSKVQAGKGRMWACLEDHKEDDSMDAECRRVVDAEMMLKHSAFHLNLRLAQYCADDAGKLCPAQVKEASFKDFHSEGVVITCLAEHFDKVNGTDCKTELKRKVGERVVHTKYDPKVKSACESDLARLCPKAKGEKEQQECIQKNYEMLSVECREKHRPYLAASSRYEMNKPVMVTCKAAVEKVCKNVFKGSGRMMQCLLTHMHHPSVDTECRKVLEKEQEKRTKHYDFNPLLKAACKADLEKLLANGTCTAPAARDSKAKGSSAWQLACLTEHSEMVRTSACKKAVKNLQLRQSGDIRAKSGAAAACEEDIQKLCPDIEKGGGRISKCLREKADKIQSPGCKKSMESIWKNDRKHASTNYRVQKYCANEISAFCKDIEAGESRLLVCLGLHLKEEGFGPKCRQALAETDMLTLMKNAPISTLQEEFKMILDRHKGFFDKWGSVLLFGTVGFVSIIAFVLSYYCIHKKLFHPGYSVVVPKDLES